LLLLEDLTLEYPVTPESIDIDQVKVCLSWLAHFHARFIGEQTDKLWSVGTYWHLATRPEEFAAMKEGPLKESAHLIDEKLSNARFKTLVHGDAKLANFCFSEDGRRVSAVDFQYVGQGCGMKDVAYFFSSCLSEQQCFDFETELLIHYFSTLNTALGDKITEKEKFELEIEWRELYPLAWADFQRFLKGWSPDHWKLNAYSDKQTRLAINQITDRRRS
jgi:aminoglycoside phosphotransferase (APT) family kinase protein